MVFSDFAEVVEHAEERIAGGESKQAVHDELASAFSVDSLKRRLFAEHIAGMIAPGVSEESVRVKSVFLAALLFILSGGSFVLGVVTGFSPVLVVGVLLFGLFSAFFLDTRNGRWLDLTRRGGWLVVGLGIPSIPYAPFLVPVVLVCGLVAGMAGAVLRTYYAPHGWACWLQRDRQGRYLVEPRGAAHVPA